MAEYVEGIITAARLTPLSETDRSRGWLWIRVQYPDGAEQIYRWPGPMSDLLHRQGIGDAAALIGRRVEGKYVGHPLLDSRGKPTGEIVGKHRGYYPSTNEAERERGWLYLLVRIKDEAAPVLGLVDVEEADEEQMELVL